MLLGTTARLHSAWKSTPTKWYPIPIGLGALYLGAQQAKKKWKGDKGEVGVDEEGEEMAVRLRGPWQVCVYHFFLSMFCSCFAHPFNILLGSRYGSFAVEVAFSIMGLSQLFRGKQPCVHLTLFAKLTLALFIAPRVVSRAWVQALFLCLWLQPG